MWRNFWPELPREEIPLLGITNGVHPRTWLSHNMVDLLDRYFGPRFLEEPTNLDIWDRMDRISDEELFRTHERRRERLVAFVRTCLKKQLIRRGKTDAELETAEDALSPYALTISFARLNSAWKQIRVGDIIQTSVEVNLGGLSPEDVTMELYTGPLSSQGTIDNAKRLEMTAVNSRNGLVEYAVEIKCSNTGRQGYAVRVLPSHPALVHSYLPGFIRWG